MNSILERCRDITNRKVEEKLIILVWLFGTGTERNSCLKKGLYGTPEYFDIGGLLRNHEQLYVLNTLFSDKALVSGE